MNRLVLLPAVALVLSLAGCGGDGGTTGPLVGAILAALTSNVDNIVQNAGAEGRATALAAAAGVQDAINNAESAFAADLSKGIEDVDERVRGNINRLQAMVADLQRGTQETLKAAAADA